MDNGFFKHLFLWMFMVPVLVILLLPLKFNKDDYQVTNSEYDQNSSVIGIVANKEASAAAKKVFEKIYFICKPTGPTYKERPSLVDNLVAKSELNASGEARCMAVVNGVYRLNVFKNFFWTFIILITAAFYDGMCVRNIVKYEFGYHNPVVFNVALNSFIAAFGFSFTAVFLPLGYTMSWFIGVVLLVCFVSWLTAKNFQKS